MVNKSAPWIFLICATALFVAILLIIKSRGVISLNGPVTEGGVTDGPWQVSGKLHDEVLDAEKVKGLMQAFRDEDVRMVSSIVQTLSAREMDKALAMLLEMKPGWKMVRSFLSAWADFDPSACAGWVVTKLPKGGDRSFLIHYVLRQWIEKDVQKAFAWVQSLSAEQGRDSALQALFDQWAGIDPESAAKGLALLKDFNSCNLTKGAIAWHWARKDIDAAIAWAWNLPKDSGYTYALYNIAMVLSEADDKARASEWAKALPSGYTNDPTLKRIAAFLTGSDSGETVSMLSENLPGGLGMIPDFQLFLIRWAKKEPDNARIWVSQLAECRGRECALYSISQLLVSGGQSTAGKVAGGSAMGDQSLSDGQTTENAKPEKMSVSEILNQDLSVAISLSEQVPDGSERDAVMHSLALRWAEDDPAGAAAWVIQQMPEGRELDVTLRTIIWNWTEKDNTGVLAWADQLTDAGKHVDAQATIAMALARTDPTAAADVVEQMPCGEVRNNVVSNVAFQWAHVDRNAVNEWAQKLTVEQGKEQALAAIQRAINN